MARFNLVDERWIPCLDLTGRPVSVGLKEVLTHAGELREIYDPSPLVTVAIHRLLLAILRRNFGPRNLSAWKALWRARRWDSDVLHRYFADYYDRFDLFDLVRPFYQVPFMEGVGTGPVQRLCQEASTGNNPTLFDHSWTERPVPIPAGTAACYLLATQAFAIGGGVSKPFNLTDAPLARGYTVLVEGENLFETLALNLIAEPESIRSRSEDALLWEQTERSPADKDGTQERGYLDYLTWESRRIHLIPEPDGRSVKLCQVQQGLKPRSDLRDPFKPYIQGKDQQYLPMRLDPGRSVWRDSHALLQWTDPARRPPDVIMWLRRIERDRLELGEVDLPEVCQLGVLGLATEPGKATAIAWTHERLPLPPSLLRDESSLYPLRDAIALAEEVAKVLRYTAERLGQVLLRREGDPAVKQVAAHLALPERYWAKLEAPFRRFLLDLPSDSDQALAEWRTQLRTIAVDAFRGATSSLMQSARELQAVAVAERTFHASLKKALASTEGGALNEPASEVY